MSGQGSKGESSQVQRVDIPAFLQNFLNQGANTASGALSQVQNLAGQDLTAGFDPLQEQAFSQAEAVAGGAGGFIPTAQNQLMDTATGRSVQSFLDPGTFDSLSGFSGDINSLLPPEALQALTQTAGGDFLFGGDGFNAAVDAATRDALPRIASAFGGTAGGIGSGLADAAVGQSAIDAFARQFGNERSNQLGAANSLAGIQGSGLNRSLNASGLLANIGNSERGRQESAISRLPEAGLLGSNLLSQIGGQRQDLNQRQLSAPFQQQLQLLQAALGGLPLEALFGQSGEGDFSQFGLSFGDG